MEEFTHKDALTGGVVNISETAFSSDTSRSEHFSECESLFFPGCALLNFDITLTRDTYSVLYDQNIVQGLSFICCGKILGYEDASGELRKQHHERIYKALIDCGVKQIVVACPNCMAELRDIISADSEEALIEVVALPQVLHEAGLKVGKEAVVDVLGRGINSDRTETLAIHDSCPDRKTGEFASAVRALFPQDSLAEMSHNRKSSRCCGSLARAAGKPEIADKQAQDCGKEGVETGANALVTYCMSCSNILGTKQDHIPVHHYLEFLFGRPIVWADSLPFMEIRFLFEALQGKRTYYGVATTSTKRGNSSPCR